MPETAATLVVACLRVHDDVANQTFTINLEDVVEMMMDDRQHPGRERSLVVSLLNAEIRARHPYLAKAERDTLAVTIDEFSGIKDPGRPRAAGEGRGQRLTADVAQCAVVPSPPGPFPSRQAAEAVVWT